ncbi:putative ABC transport system permease protein [Ekhidna lutea]|uniref:Putative ABC transport system permease protein n=1 Tax=Ekhidna lutea TaxID=447679 RepID=A0A239L4U5_EKHLU|nr:ABC transporter permease [Ekhidna lutea]SNT25330.1 putative ABC transport system permease protein [Ekhidna lutea]
MLKNYFLVAIRHLKRQPGYALLNILGLTIGIASALLIVLYLNQETSFDKHHPNAENIYRISADITEPDNAFRWAVSQPPLGKTVNEEFQEIKQFTRFAGGGNSRFRYDDRNYEAENWYLVDSTVFEVFAVNFLQGDPVTALDAPNSVAISKTLADKVFKGENPMGKLLETERFSYKVTGVYEDIPVTSHIRPDAMASFSTNERYANSQSWGGFGLYTYVVLNEGVDPAYVEKRLNDEIIPKYVATIFDQFDIKVKYEMINILDIHLYSDFQNEPSALGNIDYIYIFLAVAIFLVLIACINYMNLATARSMRRSLEVGIRKVMGAVRTSLIRQFIMESVLIALVSMAISILVLLVAVPLINDQLGTSLMLSDLTSKEIIMTLVGILIFTGLVSGSYPAFYLSGFSPIKAIKGGAGSKRTGNVWLRRVLVGIQFAVSIFMLIGTLVIYQQMQYVRNADLGFNKDQVINFSLNRATSERWETLRTKLLANPNIENASTSTTVPGNGFGKNVMQVETKEGVMEEYGVDWFGVDYDYVEVLDIELVKGRNFSRDHLSDTATAVLVNEAMVARFDWDDPIGKRFQFDRDSTVFHKVIGVIKDFHHQSMYNPIESFMIYPNLNNRQAMVKISGDLEEGIDHIQASWEELFPNAPFEYQFLDQNFMRDYESDQLRGQLFLGFALMMIIISGLGLLGLASFTAEQRTKEISVRKVLGADVKGLVLLLVKDFIWLVLVGALPAFIIGYKIMNNWLGDFEYHTEINLVIFVVVLLIVTAFVMLTTGFQAYKAASVNPADNLKYE